MKVLTNMIFWIAAVILLSTCAIAGRPKISSKGKLSSMKMKGRSAAGSSLKQDYDNRHQDVPKTPIELSVGVMTKLYKMEVADKGGLPTMQIMYKLDGLRGVPRLQTLLMFEKMDKNADGTIDGEEFVQMYGPASSSPFRVFRTLFQLFDYDHNSFISVWEILRHEATLMGFDTDLMELGKKAEQKFRAMDANGDQKVSIDEFVIFMNYLGVNSIGKVKKDASE